MRRRAGALLLATAMVGALLGTVPASAQPTETRAAPAVTDYCLSQCDDILPPGQNGNATFAELLLFKTLGIRPPHSSDQKARYEKLVWAYSGLTDEQLNTFFNDASFGVPPDQVASTTSPRPDVTIVRDKATGSPHITGTTRSGGMFGSGFAAAQDRLFLMDVLRHVGRGEVSSFAGGAVGNREFEQQQWSIAPYTEADLQGQFDRLDSYGARGKQMKQDILDFVAGINLYISQSKAGRYFPGEYVAIGKADAITNEGGPEPWKPTDVGAIASLVGGIFGAGGGQEVASAVALVEARARYGREQGDKVWAAFRAQNDPEAPMTVHNGTSFPYGQSTVDAAGVVLPDRGTVVPQPIVRDATGPAGKDSLAPLPPAQRGMSNALLVSGAHTQSGHPVAVFGPQTGYFAPQLLSVQEIQAPGISSRGASFAGLNLYTLLGRGVDYSWSATTAAQDITDAYTVELCEPGGGAPTLQSQHYRFRGECLAIEELTKKNAWKPSLADPTAEGSYTLVAQRTKLGLISHRGLVAGKPVAFTKLRSTYLREVEATLGFQLFNDPDAIRSAADFQRAASQIGYAFNWFYADSKDIAYYNSGFNPVRRDGHNPNLPVRGEAAYEWQDWRPGDNSARYTPFEQHPQVVNQDYLTSWNNKQAPQYSASDGNFSFGPVHRSQPLDDRIKPLLARGEKFTRAKLTKAMADASTVDLRADKVLPLLLRVLDKAPVTEPALATAVSQLKLWAQAGGHRTTDGDPTVTGKYVYAHTDAIRILDAWFPLVAKAIFEPGLQGPLYRSLTGVLQVDEQPGHTGSAFQYGWYGYVHKDLRAVLGEPVQAWLPTPFCGGGNLAACHTALLDSLRTAVQTPATTTYPGDADCKAGDQFCRDQIIHRPVGGITQDKTQWQNRPTYQQVVEFPARRGEDVANLARTGSVTASSHETGMYPSPPAKAVDGDRTTRWASDWSDRQSLTVDLGSVREVGRALLRWESAYGKAYRIEVSTDGQAWRTAAEVTGGDGGEDNVPFAATQARFVRMTGISRATRYGYSLFEFEVYGR
ncbi:acyl-homoserine lactone acylase PvdQ [Crossiella equi]|uniref:Acyl-homoserine lactone acylase PvdQ n=1 Tax=Crossiella equi TaxID=130796 RepID=A0ABS5AFE7_9PSEU|nr:penicillin acylase family protein [Crossiella equi]MBP2474924.1 acyl-homoserine lactone acylase PvdQ [Crossiella equi]